MDNLKQCNMRVDMCLSSTMQISLKLLKHDGSISC